MLKRFQAAEFPGDQLILFMEEGHREEGGLVVVYPGTNPKAKAILLVAHIDVVEAKREDWERDPFTLIEENGYFYARGASDDKAMAASFTDNMIRYKKEGFKPRRGLRLALTCGEESPDSFNGVEWLLANRPEVMKAEFALNEGAGGRLDAKGERVFLGIQAGEKVYQGIVQESDATEKIYGMEWESLYTTTGSDGLPVGRDDLIQTRQNDTALGVANRQQWIVQHVEPVGSLWAREAHSDRKREHSVHLPADEPANATGSTCTRTAGFWPPESVTRPTPAICEIFCASTESA